MTFGTLILRSLRFHWRSHLGVALGAVVGSAALVGALVVGDSARESLRETALNKIGEIHLALDARDHFFRRDLAGEIQRGLLDKNLPAVTTVPAILVNGTASTTDGSARANHLQVIGVENDFWKLARSQCGFGDIPRGTVMLNEPLARQLGVRVGDTVIIRIPKVTALAREFVVSPKSDSTIALRFVVHDVISAEDLGNFTLQTSQITSFNAFVSIADLQDRLDTTQRANLMLVGGYVLRPESNHYDSSLRAGTSEQLGKRWRLTDAQVELRLMTNENMMQLQTSEVFISPPVVRAALAADTNAHPIFTYLANLLRAGTNSTPYSMVAAAGAPWTSVDMRDDEIIINQWLADDLEVKPGDEIALTYFDPESGARLTERTNAYRVRAIVPMEMPWADRTLMPDFPGIEKAGSTRDWDAGFPLVYKIRPKDEDYWEKYRGTPKAFATLTAGQKMWANRFGNLTAIRFSIPTDSNERDFRDALEKQILSNLKPEELGLRFEPVGEQALKAVEQSQDFSQLFLGFSIFLIVAALLLMAMLFQFGLEQRTTEIGTLLALGFAPRQVRRLLLGEGMALSFLGGALGTLGGMAYARAMLHGLATIWRDAVGASVLKFHATPQTLAIGLFASVVVSAATIWLTLRKFVRRPARELLAGEVLGSESRASSRGRLIGAATVIVAIGLVGWTLAKGDTANAGAFFGAGALVLIAALGFVSAWLTRLQAGRIFPNLQRTAPPTLTLGSLSIRGCARRRKRSLATVAMLACGSFLIVSIGVFRLDANRDATKWTSGTGGFALIGEATMPVVQDLNSKSGRDFFVLSERDLKGVNFVPFRVHDGDEASCLNLNHAQTPRLLGVKPELLDGRFSFAKGRGWQLLKSEIQNPKSEIEIPAIGDENSIVWSMGKKVGDAIDYVDECGQPFKVRIVGAVANSILQGGLIIDESEFVKRFPSESGYRMFLIDVPTNRMPTVLAMLSRAMQDTGLELTPAASRLAQFNAVQNTYLGTFQVLGGLGLLLGSVGLGIVVLRNVLERRAELAVLLAVGFRKPMLQRLLLIENGALLALGLGIGVAAAAVAVLPAMLSPSAQLPYRSMTVTLLAVVANGLLWTWAATRLALRRNLLSALRNE